MIIRLRMITRSRGTCFDVFRLLRRKQIASAIHRDENNVERRVWEHKHDLIEGFSATYRCHRLVYYESFDDVRKAIDREKQLKRWSRAKKVRLIERTNPTWEDLAEDLGKPHRYKPEKQVPPLAN